MKPKAKSQPESLCDLFFSFSFAIMDADRSYDIDCLAHKNPYALVAGGWGSIGCLGVLVSSVNS